MSGHVRKTSLLLAVTALLGTATAVAWTPYGYGPYGPDQPPPGPAPGVRVPATEQGTKAGVPTTPDNSPYGAAPGFPAPGGPSIEPEGYGPQPPVYTPYGPGAGLPGMAGPGFHGLSRPLQISRHATADAYVIDIQLNDMKPDDIQVTTQGNWIRIGQNRSRQEVREDNFDEGRGYSRSYSFSSGSASRRFSVPRDANLEALTREVKDGVLRILIPRRQQ